MSKNYRFGLFDSHDELLDQTNISEDNDELAMDLFREFSAHEGYSIHTLSGHYVELLEETDEDDD